MHRYRFTKENVAAAKNFLKTGKGKKPSFLNKFTGTLKKGFLMLDNKQVILPEQVDKLLRKKVLDGKVPMTRDGLHYYLKQFYAGVSRAKIDAFLKQQNVIRKTDRMQPSTKRKKRRVTKKGQIGFDLIEINWKDLGFKPTEVKKFEKTHKNDPDFDPEDPENEEKTEQIRIPVRSAYMFSAVDKITGLMFVKFAIAKNRKRITPVAKQAFKYFATQFKIPMSKLIVFSDRGSEFDFKLYKKWGIRTVQLAREPLIEKKNSQFQAALYRIAKMNLSKSIDDLITRALKVVNRTKSKLLKMAPYEAVDVPEGKLAEPYNKKRGKGSGVTVTGRALKVGDMVRLNLIGPKKDSFYKAYKGKQYSVQRYKVLQKRGNRYKIDGPKGKKFYHRDDLRLTPESDKITDEILKKRSKTLK